MIKPQKKNIQRKPFQFLYLSDLSGIFIILPIKTMAKDWRLPTYNLPPAALSAALVLDGSSGTFKVHSLRRVRELVDGACGKAGQVGDGLDPDPARFPLPSGKLDYIEIHHFSWVNSP